MESRQSKKITLRKYLIRDLLRNIELDVDQDLEFNGYVFSYEGDDTYYVSSPDGRDIGSVNVNSITEQWLKMRCNKSQKKEPKQMKQTKIKAKPRKVKRNDIILSEFMVHLHTQECIVEGCYSTSIEAHHVYGRQPMRHDILCVPLCPFHHRGSEFSVHEGSVTEFRKKYTKNIMSQKSIEILAEWVNNEGSHILSDDMIRMFSDLIPYLANIDNNYDIAIKEFLIEYRNRDTEEESHMGYCQ